MAIAGSLTYDTKIDKDGFKKGLNSIEKETSNAGTKIKNIITALGITKIISSAFNVINNSLDGAISRLDTMNNFPKVMSNLGIGAEESKVAINELSERLKGIPTTLDAAALSVERFSSKNGDVKKSVEIFTAINNALLAGGASSEIQASALEQLSQAYAKGKPDMVEWRSIQTAMPAQLKQVAQAMGTTTDALGEDLRKGNISMDEFINTIIKLNKEGTGQFQSFEKQAKNATGGIATSITNAKTAVTRGIANIVTAVDDLLSKNNLGGISSVIQNIGKTSEKILTKIAKNIAKINLKSILDILDKLRNIYEPMLKKFMSNTMTNLKNVWNWVKKNQSLIIALIGTISSLILVTKTYKGILSAIKTINAVQGIISAIQPTTALIALVVGLGTALAATTAILGKHKISMNGLKEEVDLQQKSWKALGETRKETLESSLGEINLTQQLANELRQITDENGKVKAGYENRAKYILGELNSALGTEYSMNDGIIQQYGELKNNIDQLIAKKKAEAMISAYSHEYAEAKKNEANATQELIKLQEKYSEALKNVQKASSYKERAKAQAELGLIGKEIQQQTEMIDGYGWTIRNYEELTSASVSGNADKINQAVENIGMSYDNAKNKTSASLAEQITQQAEYLTASKQAWTDAQKNHDEYLEGLTKSQKDAHQKQLDELVNSLTEQTNTVGDLSEEQKNAWKALADGSEMQYRLALSRMPEDTKKKIEEATGKMEDGSTYMNDSAKLLADNANSGFNDNVDGSKWGKDLSDNISSGMTSKSSKSKITNAASTVAGIIHSILGHSVPEAGPLKDELTYMPDMIDNFAKGIKNNKYKISNEIENLTEEMSNKMQNAVVLETGSISTNAIVKSSTNYNSIIRIENKLDGTVNLDNRKLGRIQAPVVARTIKAGGLV